MKKFITILLFLALFFTANMAWPQTHTRQGSVVIVNTSNAIIFHATDCTGETAVEGVVCYEADSNRIFVCEPSAGDCDTAGEWVQIAYCNLTGCTMTGPIVGDLTGDVTGNADTCDALNGFSGATETTPGDGDVLVYDTGTWVNLASVPLADEATLAPDYVPKSGGTSTGKQIFTTIKLTPQASPPGTPASGDIYVDSTPDPDELCFYDGADWQGISSGTDANCQ